MKKKKNIYIAIIFVFLIYFVLLYLIWGRSEINKRKADIVFLIGENTIFQKINNKWYNITSASSIENLNWQKYHVYISGMSAGSYYLWHSDKWYLFDKNKNPYNYSGTFFAYDANVDVKVSDFEVGQIDTYQYIHQVLEENHLSSNQTYTTQSLTNFDIDNDGEKESFYVVSNAFDEENNPTHIFSFVFMVKENKIYLLYNSVEKNKMMNGCKPYISNFLDIDSDSRNELILACARYSVQEPIYMLYKFDSNEFKILITNQ